MTTVLVPVGHEIEASRAMSQVARLVHSESDHVVVLHVHERGLTADGGSAAEQEPDLQCIAEIVAHTLRRAGLPAQWRSVTADSGDVATAIAVTAAQVHADVVLVGDSPTWLSTHRGVRAQLEELLSDGRIVRVRTPC